MICFPNAKINIGLHVTSRRKDGYHNLETLFYPIGLKDALEIIPSRAKEHRLFVSGIHMDGHSENNLVMKALRLIEQEHVIPPLDIHLLKKIPTGAGLGGGSSNAAFMLHLVNKTFQLGYEPGELALKAASLGADCPFFIHNKPALATGIGDTLTPVSIDLSDYFLLVVKPDVFVSTPEAYAQIVPTEPEQSLRVLLEKPVEEWKEWIKNDFEQPLFQQFPQIAQVKQQLYKMGAVYTSMSGSGSAVYAFFRDEPDWKGTFKDCFTWSSTPL